MYSAASILSSSGIALLASSSTNRPRSEALGATATIRLYASQQYAKVSRFLN